MSINNKTEKEKILKKFESNISSIQKNETSFEKLIYLILLTDDFDNLIKFTKEYKKMFPAYILATAFFFCKKICILRYFLCGNIKFEDDPREKIINDFQDNPNKTTVNNLTLDTIKKEYNFLAKFIEEKRLTDDNKYYIFQNCYKNIIDIERIGDLKCTKNMCGIKKIQNQ
jgi:hypothetical protein